MAKIKYFYNPHSLDFEKVTTSVRTLAFRVFGFLSASIVAGAIFLIAAYNLIDSPKERMLKREIEHYKIQSQVLNQKTDKLAAVLQELQERDATIYRSVFEAEPISASVRQGGFGGVEKYRELEGYDNSEELIALNKKIDQLSKQLYVQSKSFDELSKLASRKTDFLASIPAIQPIANKDLRRMASGFGYRIHPIYKTHKMHEGIDFTAPTGTPIYATGNGKVVDPESGMSGYGNFVVIDHGFGYKTLYGHMSRVSVRSGQKIKRGELIGYVGNTGLSSGPHLHYEVIKGERKINPINYFFNDLSEQEYSALRELAERPAQSFD
jgi:murein DD-endopeptidase MepM/ murein hydrolase activator NlpD